MTEHMRFVVENANFIFGMMCGALMVIPISTLLYWLVMRPSPSQDASEQWYVLSRTAPPLPSGQELLSDGGARLRLPRGK